MMAAYPGTLHHKTHSHTHTRSSSRPDRPHSAYTPSQLSHSTDSLANEVTAGHGLPGGPDLRGLQHLCRRRERHRTSGGIDLRTEAVWHRCMHHGAVPVAFDV